jgi:hypothetical protein
MKNIASIDSLCRPTDPFQLQAPVLTRDLPDKGYRLSIRPFCVTTDMSAVCNWLGQELGMEFGQGGGRGREAEAGQEWESGMGPELERGVGPEPGVGPEWELRKVYIDILQSGDSQSLLCLLDKRPVCALDIGRAALNEVFMYRDTADGDYSFRMILSPYVTLRNAYVDVVQTFLDYFFSFPNVKRVLTYLPVYDEWGNHLLQCAGFHYLDTGRTLSGAVNLYACAAPCGPGKGHTHNIF